MIEKLDGYLNSNRMILNDAEELSVLEMVGRLRQKENEIIDFINSPLFEDNIPTTIASHTAKLNDIAISVKDFGAKGDGLQDDTPFIQDALDLAGVKGGTVLIPVGTYKIAHTLQIYDNITVIGEGQASVLSADTTTDGFTMLLCSGKSNFTLTNFKLQGNASLRTLTNPMNGIAANNGVCYSRFDRLFFEGMGCNVVDPNNPGSSENNTDSLGVCINIDTNEANKTTRGNVIENCVFIDADKRCAFGIRIFTEWWTSKDPEQLLSKACFNTIKNCYFDGFTFNVIEIAGSGAEFNHIDHNISVNCTAYSGIEADKGARRNVFSFNIVRDMKPINAMQSAFRDQGIDPDATAGYPARHSQGNVWHGNIAKNLTEHPSNTTNSFAAMLLADSDFTVVTDLFVDGITPAVPDKTSTAAVVIIGGCTNINIKGLVAKGVPVGVYVSSGIDGLNIANSYLSASKYCFETQGGTNVNKNISILNSRLTVNGGQYPIQFSNETNMLVRGNIIDGFTGGVYTPNSKGIVISDNIVQRTGGGNGFVITADQSLVNNMFIGCTYGYTEGRNVVNGNHSDVGGKSITFMAAAPTSGQWYKGDMVYNSNPAASTTLGWVCVSSGIPGTWKAMSNLSA